MLGISTRKITHMFLDLYGLLFEEQSSPFVYEENLEDKNENMFKTLELRLLENLTAKHKDATQKRMDITLKNNDNIILDRCKEDEQLFKIYEELVKEDLINSSDIPEKEKECFVDAVRLAFIDLENLAFLDHQPKMVFKAEIPNEIEDIQEPSKLSDAILKPDQNYNELVLASKMIFQDEKIIEDYKEYVSGIHSLLSITEKYPNLKTTIENMVDGKKVPISQLHDMVCSICKHIKETKDQKCKDLRALRLFIESITTDSQNDIQNELKRSDNSKFLQSNLEKVLELIIRNHNDCYKMLETNKKPSDEHKNSNVSEWSNHPYLIFYIGISGLGYVISLVSYLI